MYSKIVGVFENITSRQRKAGFGSDKSLTWQDEHGATLMEIKFLHYVLSWNNLTAGV